MKMMLFQLSTLSLIVIAPIAFSQERVANPIGNPSAIKRATLPVCAANTFLAVTSQGRLECKPLPVRGAVDEIEVQSTQTDIPELDATGTARIVRARCPAGTVLLSCGGGAVKSGIRKPDEGGSLRAYATTDIRADYVNNACLTAFPAEEWDIINWPNFKPELMARAYCEAR